MIRLLHKHSLDKYLQSQYDESLSDDTVEDGTHFVYTNNNQMYIYNINRAEKNNNKYNILKMFNQEKNDWDKYKLTLTSIINLNAKYIWNPSIGVISRNNNKSELFIKYEAPHHYNEFVEAVYSERVKLLIKLIIDHENNQIVERESVNVNIPHDEYDLFSSDKNNQIFEFDNKLYGLAQSHSYTDRLKHPYKTCAHLEYDPIGNKFNVKHIMKLRSSWANLDIVMHKKLLCIFETYTMVPQSYYLRIHTYYSKEDKWIINEISNPPILFRYWCYSALKGYWIAFFDQTTTNGYNDGIYLFNSQTNDFIKSPKSLPICAKYKAITIYNEEHDFLLVSGFIRCICAENNLAMSPEYLLKRVCNYYVKEDILLMCSSVDKCMEYIWNRNTERHNFYRFKTWRIPADDLFL